MRDRAVELARQGFRIFPLRAGAKTPPIIPAGRVLPPKGEYQDHIPSNDPEEVARMWTAPGPLANPLPYNIGICTNDLLAIDIDNKNGKRGIEAWIRLIQELGIPELTVATLTPTGGQHRFYKLPNGGRAGLTVGKLGEGVDTRGWHGYVVAPGSKVPAGEYKWLYSPSDQPMATAPEALLARCAAPKEREKPAAIEGLELDTPEAIERATYWLIAHAPEAVEGAGGDNTTYQVACRVKDFAISEHECLQLLSEHWNQDKAHPPWPIEQLEQKVANAYLYGKEPIGARSAQADFDAVDVETGAEGSSTEKRGTLNWCGFQAGCDRMAGQGASWLVKKYLGRNEMSVLYGDSNTGKTFVALDWDYHIATGKPWNGHKVEPGLVVYVAAEAGPGIYARLAALRRRYKPDKEPPLVVIPCLVDLFTLNADLKPLLATLEAISKAYNLPVAKVTLDTLARVIGPGDENSARDMGVLVKSMDRIRVSTGGAHTMAVHHSGKNKANGARGSSALRAATDTELEIEGGRIIMRKQRNGEIVKAITFKLVPVDLGKDSEGDTVTSCTVDLGAAADFEPQLTHEQQEWLEQLKEYAAPLGLDELTYKQMQSAWSQPQRDLEPGFGSGVNKIAPCPISTTKLRATGLENSARLERVSKNDERPVRYKLAPDQSN
jgi:hypothetical protein